MAVNNFVWRQWIEWYWRDWKFSKCSFFPVFLDKYNNLTLKTFLDIPKILKGRLELNEDRFVSRLTIRLRKRDIAILVSVVVIGAIASLINLNLWFKCFLDFNYFAKPSFNFIKFRLKLFMTRIQCSEQNFELAFNNCEFFQIVLF